MNTCIIDPSTTVKKFPDHYQLLDLLSGYFVDPLNICSLVNLITDGLSNHIEPTKLTNIINDNLLEPTTVEKIVDLIPKYFSDVLNFYEFIQFLVSKYSQKPRDTSQLIKMINNYVQKPLKSQYIINVANILSIQFDANDNRPIENSWSELINVNFFMNNVNLKNYLRKTSALKFGRYIWKYCVANNPKKTSSIFHANGDIIKNNEFSLKENIKVLNYYCNYEVSLRCEKSIFLEFLIDKISSPKINGEYDHLWNFGKSDGHVYWNIYSISRFTNIKNSEYIIKIFNEINHAFAFEEDCFRLETFSIRIPEELMPEIIDQMILIDWTTVLDDIGLYDF